MKFQQVSTVRRAQMLAWCLDVSDQHTKHCIDKLLGYHAFILPMVLQPEIEGQYYNMRIFRPTF